MDDPKSAHVIEDLESSGHHIDVLVSNAGFAVLGPVEALSENGLRRMMETMYFGPLRLIKTALPYMRKRRFGVVVNMSSGAGLEGRECMGGYGAVKAAMDGM